jgi:aspartate kinase
VPVLRSAHPETSRLLVVSALGKTTNGLIALAEAAGRNDLSQAQHHYEALRGFHRALLERLFSGPSAERLWQRLEERYWHPLWQRAQALAHLSEEVGPATDAVLVYGELISSEIVQAFLQAEGFPAEWIDARRLLVTDGAYPEPSVLLSPSQANVDAQLVPLFRSHKLVITQGYIASDLRRRSVTLGREGSDYSAALFAQMLRAQGMIAWKDVGRLYSADPRRYADAVPLTELSYAQAAEMTYYGAQVLHPRTLKPLRDARIPLYVRDYFQPEAEGTLVAERWVEPLPPIRTQRRGLTLIEVESQDLTSLSLAERLQELETEGIEVYFIQGGVRTIALAVKGPQEAIERWKAGLAAGHVAQVRQPVTLYTVLYPDESVTIPNGEALYLQRLPDRIHWIAYEG